ncbi:putative RNA methyltransferase pc0248 [Chlamydiales bacterium STE3]|nr:putative RNA methyltransferase pc0248 [Chlamydiales bacterium STE3]
MKSPSFPQSSPKEYKAGEIITGKIESIAFGGKGILRTREQFVIFVPYAAPQDIVQCVLTKIKKGYAEGKLLKVIRPSPLRVQPTCAYFGTCGGCQLQHLNYEEQLDSKAKAIKDSLSKFAKIETFPFYFHSAQQQWQYRRHIYLTLQAKIKGFQVGYIASDQTTFLSIDHCPIFVSPDQMIFKELQALTAEMSSEKIKNGKLMVVKHPEGGYLLHFHFKHWSSFNFEVIKKHFALQSIWKGLIYSSPAKSQSLGKCCLITEIDRFKIHYSSYSFMQNHPDESVRIYQKLASISQKIQPKNILDLYCGIGISSLFLSQRAETLLGIEENAAAIDLARKNASINSVKNAHFMKGKVEEALLKLPTDNIWDFILVNPPRTGLEHSVVQKLLEFSPRHLVYVSCMPTTLARDIKYFAEKGYKVQECQAFDMFPQTAHVETLVHLKNPSSKNIQTH